MTKKNNDDNNTEQNNGNIWGWNFSKIGGIVLLSMISLMAYRHITLGVKPSFQGENFLDVANPHLKKLKDTMNVTNKDSVLLE